MTVSATAIFQQGEQGITGSAQEDLFKKWESDAVANGYEGDTIFQNKPFYFYLQHDIKLRVDSWHTNTGSILPVGLVERQRVEDLIRFHGVGANTHDLAWMPYGTPDYTWFDDRESRSFSLSGRRITVSLGSCPTCLTVIYNFKAMQYKYTPPVTDLAPGVSYPVATRFNLEII